MKGCVFVKAQYTIELKKKLCKEICLNGKSTIKTAQEYNIPLKTLEKWITAYNKNHNVFDSNYISQAQQIELLKKKIKDLQRDNDILKKTITLLAKKE